MNPANGLELADEIYRENILDHYKNPHNSGLLPHPSASRREYNPLCGDDITMTLSIRNGTITDIKFLGRGCAISQAAASMLTDMVKGQPLSAVEQLTPDTVRQLLSIPLSPVRLKCALLGLDALKNALKTYSQYINHGRRSFAGRSPAIRN